MDRYSTSNPFCETYKLYKKYVPYSGNLTYNKWMRLDDRYKAAALFVHFYDTITLAWFKRKTAWSIEEEGVEVINQYLIKNVEKIKGNPKRFRPQYIYTVAVNCFYCICVDPSKNKDRYFNEVNPELGDDENEFSWFDLIGEDEVEYGSSGNDFTTFLESLDPLLQAYVAYTLDEITEFQLWRELKAHHLYDGSLRDKEACRKVAEEFVNNTRTTLKGQITVKFPDLVIDFDSDRY